VGNFSALAKSWHSLGISWWKLREEPDGRVDAARPEEKAAPHIYSLGRVHPVEWTANFHLRNT
jgi:hypothetical protein